MKSPLLTLLRPFSWAYDGVTRLRNHLYNLGIRPSVAFELPVIAIGNLVVGGSGKTPMIEYLIRLLSTHKKIAVISRGYRRKTKGIRIAGTEDTSVTIGDEPMQMYQKFKDHGMVMAVGSDRPYVLSHVLQEHPEVEAVLLDDAFQHRRLRAQLNILLTTFHRPFFNDYVLPAGLLRESRKGASRAHVVVVTKCSDDLSDEEMLFYEKQIAQYTPAPVFFCGIDYDSPVGMGNSVMPLPGNIILVSGIADALPLVEYLRKTFTVAQHFDFSDHHYFSEDDLDKIHEAFLKSKATAILTTEKDMMRLQEGQYKHLLTSLPWFIVPVRMRFLKNGLEFDRIVQHATQQAD